LLGSVAVELASYAQCPVLVVRGRPGASGPVVVGVDGGAAGETIADLALSWATVNRLTVRAVHAAPEAPSRRARPAGERDRRWAPDAAAVPAVFALVEMSRRAYPGVDVERVVCRGDARRVLVRESDHGSLVVVGSRGRGGFEGLLLGSVSHATLHHAECPVVVVPHGIRRLRPPLGPLDVQGASDVER
jgi:nucleotide-binding universal stress UspA family protein